MADQYYLITLDLSTRKCSKCGITKPLFQFYMRETGKRRTDCKVCRSIYGKERLKKLHKNHEWVKKEKDRSRKRLSDPQYKEKQKNHHRRRRSGQEWVNKERKRLREFQRNKRLNPDYIENERKSARDRKRNKYKTDPEYAKKVREWGRKHGGIRRARKQNTKIEDIPSLGYFLDRQGGRCAFCKRVECRIKSQVDGRAKFHIDHIVPLARGGTHTADNIQVLCYQCNTQKGSKDPIEFAQSNGRLL